MKDAPQAPFLPFALEQNNINARREALKIAQQIGEESQDPNRMPKEETLSKFNILARLVRIMKQKDIHAAGQELFSQQDQEDFHSSKSAKRNAAWKAYRDAVAEAGTPASFATIVQWIQDKKVQENEAAAMIATQPKAMRYPTEEVMKAFYELATSEMVQKQKFLNATALHSLANFLRQSQVSNHSAYSFYPTHAFGRMASKSYRIVQRQVIPYLAHKMNIASQNEDSEKMLTYIRALGNLAHPAILSVFEPYLEGKMPTTEFQRLAIVVAMDKLTKQYPRLTRPILFRIYQNSADRDEVRAAAVFAIMRTNPDASMLQRMAEMTNVEKSVNVASAVKTALESAAELDHPDYRQLSENAAAAIKMLSSDVPAAQNSRSLMTDYIMKELNLAYALQASVIASDDSLMPKAFFLRTVKNMGGYKNRDNDYVAMVSSVNDLVDMISERIRPSGSSKNQYQNDKQNRRSEPTKQNKKFNFENIEHLLDIQAEQVQELEGQILMKIANTQRFFAFNNESIENLPRNARRAAKALADGQQFNATKWFNQEQITIGFPLASGLPFLFTYKTPTLMRAGGEIRLRTYPDMAQGNDEQIRAPKSINASAEFDVLYATQTDARVGFLTLFDHQRYVAGVQKKIQARLPMRITINVNTENGQVYSQMEALDQKNDITLLHASSWPYTQRRHIQAAFDSSKEADTKRISTADAKEYDQRFGQASTGMVIHVNAKYEKEFIDAARVMDCLKRHDLVSLIMYTTAAESNEYYNIKVELDNQRSQAQSVKVKLQYDYQESFEDGPEKPKHPKDTSNYKNSAHPTNTEANSDERREQFKQNAQAGVANAKVRAIDASISFQGKQQKTAQYIFTIAHADSQANNHQRFLCYLSANPSKESKKQMCLHVESEMPDVPQMNFVNALNMNEKAQMRVELDFGDKCKDGQHITIKAKMARSEERRKAVEHSPLGNQCKQQMKNGDNQMPACQNATFRANFYDQYTISADYENLSSKAKNAAQNAYAWLRHLGFYYVQENASNGKSKSVEAQISLAPNMRSANVSLESPNVSTQWKNLPVPSWARSLPVHPGQNVAKRLAYQATQGQIQRELTFARCIFTLFYHSMFILSPTEARK